MKRFQNLYLQIIDRCRAKQSKFYLYLISFLESIVFPIPTDIFLIPYVLANKEKYFSIAILTTFFSVLGGCIAFLVGLFFWDYATLFFDKYYPSINPKLNLFTEEFKEYGILLIIIGGFSPFPYKVTCFASGIMGLNLAIFIIFSFISRGLRFLLVCYFLYKLEEKANKYIPKYIGYISLLIIIFMLVYIFIKNF